MTRSSVYDPEIGRRPALRNGHVDDGTVTQNTLSADGTHVQVFYPLHPLHGYSLRVIRRPKRGDGAVSVRDASGKRLKIPVWMLLPDAAHVDITEQAYLSRESLLNLASLLLQRIAAENRDNLLQTSFDEWKGDDHGAAATDTPGPTRRGTRARRKDGKSRTGQPHGAHSGDGIANGSKEDR